MTEPDLGLVATDRLLAELGRRFDGMLFAAASEPVPARVAWTWWRAGKPTLFPFLMTILNVVAGREVHQLLGPLVAEAEDPPAS